MLKSPWKRILRILAALISIAILVLLGPRLIIRVQAGRQTYSINAVPAQRVAIVFGAGLWRDGSPTPILRERVAAAAELYFTGKVEKLLMSGDNRFVYYNEPGAMREFALSLNIPEDAIVLDYAGRRTYDTCYRAKAVFGVKEAILVTQDFHLPRALYLCNSLGVSAVGVSADGHSGTADPGYRRSTLFYWNMREIPAVLAALWEVNISHPVPVLGDLEPIFPDEGQDVRRFMPFPQKIFLKEEAATDEP